MRFRKKPVEIEAFQFQADPGRVPTPEWLAAALNNGTAWYQGGDEPYITLGTPEGEMRANVGDWIVKGIKNELYPVKDDVFQATYERVLY